MGWALGGFGFSLQGCLGFRVWGCLVFRRWGCLGCRIEGLGLKWFRGFKRLRRSGVWSLRGYGVTGSGRGVAFNSLTWGSGSLSGLLGFELPTGSIAVPVCALYL